MDLGIWLCHSPELALPPQVHLSYSRHRSECPPTPPAVSPSYPAVHQSCPAPTEAPHQTIGIHPLVPLLKLFRPLTRWSTTSCLS